MAKTKSDQGHPAFFRRLVLLLILLCWWFPQACFGQSNTKWHTTVQVKYAAPDLFVSQIRSYVSREIRALGDVDETETNPEFVVKITALELKTAVGTHNGYAVHVTVLRPIERFLDLLHLLNVFRSDQQASFDKLFAGYVLVENEDLYSCGGVDNLDTLAKRIVAESVDGDVLELRRKQWRETQKSDTKQ